jgi:copper chaperone CopZ
MNKNLLIFCTVFLSGISRVDATYCTTTTDKLRPGNVIEDDGKTLKLKIMGMTCAGCSNQIANALKKVEGFIELKVEYPGDLATIQDDPSKTNPETIIKVIHQTGYKAEVLQENQKKKS